MSEVQNNHTLILQRKILLICERNYLWLPMFILLFQPKRILGRDFVLGPLCFFLRRFWRFWDKRFLALLIHHWKAREKLVHLHQGQLPSVICLEVTRVQNFEKWAKWVVEIQYPVVKYIYFYMKTILSFNDPNVFNVGHTMQ